MGTLSKTVCVGHLQSLKVFLSISKREERQQRTPHLSFQKDIKAFETHVPAHAHADNTAWPYRSIRMP